MVQAGEQILEITAESVDQQGHRVKEIRVAQVLIEIVVVKVAVARVAALVNRVDLVAGLLRGQAAMVYKTLIELVLVFGMEEVEEEVQVIMESKLEARAVKAAEVVVQVFMENLILAEEESVERELVVLGLLL
ncbi:MAG: hypothetical protein CL464_11130 [Acidimicrobiaceae bacterium]|nr:hypothetical protein [Acidimicrobiaceae bacterium]